MRPRRQPGIIRDPACCRLCRYRHNRHTFLCRALVRSYQQQEVDHVIDVLSTYVGHARVSDTYWYITAVPELLALAAERFAPQGEGGAL
jgi:hypothetical protein